MLDDCVPWPTDIARHYRQEGYWRGRSLGDLLTEWSHRYGDAVALVDDDRRFTYRQIDRAATRVAAGLAARGVTAGERIVVQLPNVAEFVILSFACYRLGALPIHALTAHRRSEITHLCTLSGAVAYVIPDVHRDFDHRELAAEVRAEAPDLRNVFVVGEPGPFDAFADLLADGPAEPPWRAADASDVAFFLLSGGTTALPKLIPRTHDDFAYQIDVAAGLSDVGAGTVYLATLPVPFNFTWGCPGVLGILTRGGVVVLSPSPSPAECFRLIERERVTMTSVVPTVVHTWLDAVPQTAHDLSSLRLIQIGSAKLHPEVAARVEPTLRCRLQQVFGMAEGLLTFTRLDDPPQTVLTTQGRPISPGDEVRIVGPDDTELPPGEIGELLARGPYTLRGYFRAAEHNARAFTADGFYRSGDLALRTEHGDVVIEGRIKEVINRGGQKISAVEIERLVCAHPAVQQAAAVPMPDPVLGERICVYVVAPEGAPELTEVRDLLISRGVAGYKMPDRIEPIGTLPVTGLNKVDKKALVADIAAKLAAVG